MLPHPKYKTQKMGVFDYSEMERWLAHMRDADPLTGLPKALVRAHWDRRTVSSTLGEHNGRGYLQWEFAVFEYDSGTDDWSRLRTRASVRFLRKDP
jgi:hypothetical protein